jgi:hypothetical protein
MRAGFRVNQLRVDAHPSLIALHRAFEDVADAELFADLLGVDGLALVGEGGVARDHEAVADAREIGCEVFGDPIGEIVLGGIARKIGEGQDHDGEVRGRGGRGRVRCNGRGRRYREGRRAARAEEIPGAGCGQYRQRGDSEPEWRERRASLRSCGLRDRRRADVQRVDPDRLGDVLEPGRAEIGHGKIEPPLDLPIGVLRQTDRAGLANAFEARGDIDAVAHQIAVGLLDDVAEMNADAKLDAALGR